MTGTKNSLNEMKTSSFCMFRRLLLSVVEPQHVFSTQTFNSNSLRCPYVRIKVRIANNRGKMFTLLVLFC